MDLTFQVPRQYCCLQHQTLLPLPVTSKTGCCFCFDSISSFFLELFLHWSPVAYWIPIDLRTTSFSVLSFCLFIWFMGFSRQEYWSSLQFPSPVDHILSELSTNNTREHTGRSKQPLPTTQEKTLHTDITKWSILKSDWLYSLQPKMEKLYTVSKNKTGNWLQLRSWTPYWQIQA